MSVESEFLAVAQQAMRSGDSSQALESLGWWDLLAHLDDPEMRLAALTVFRAQGGALGDAATLGAVLAQPFLSHTDLGSTTVLATVRRERRHGPAVQIVVGDPTGRSLLIDHPGHGATVIDLDQVDLCRVSIPGHLTLNEVQVHSSAVLATIPEDAAAVARAHSMYLGRIAIAMEILGAAEQVLAMAIDYSTNREQFGRPIGAFQAMRHLLAWGRTECIAIEAVAYNAIRLAPAPPVHFGEVLKALAGRNGRKVCQRTLQVLGGIGFTAEHDHHHFHSRILALDSLLGTSAELTHQLGAHLRTSAAHPGFPAAILGLAAS